MTEWTQKALRAEALRRLNDAEGCEYFVPDDAATILVAELIGRCEQPPVDPFREMLAEVMEAYGFDRYAEQIRGGSWGAVVATLRERFEAMLAERMGK